MPRDPEVTSRIMSSIKSEGTQPEKALGRAMWALGLRYRKNYRKVAGTPDFVFIGVRLAVFCDGDFWHGNSWRIRGMESFEEELSTYNDFWRKKITNNVIRDKKVNYELEANGWRVLRFWESELKSNIDACADKVLKVYGELKENQD